jgi:hypothetical protein
VDVEQSGVRCWRLLQIDGRVRENKRGKGGGGLARCHEEEGKRERERAPGAAVGSADSGDGMAPGSVVRGGVLAVEAG